MSSCERQNLKSKCPAISQPLHKHSHSGTGQFLCPGLPSTPSNHIFACSAWNPCEHSVQRTVNLCIDSYHLRSRSCFATSSSTTSSTVCGRSAVVSFPAPPFMSVIPIVPRTPVTEIDGAFELGPIAVIVLPTRLALISAVVLLR